MIDYNEPQLDPNYRDISYIGEIEFPDILNEREIGGNDRVNFKNIGKCKIEVYSGEGQVPHFHLNSIDGKFESCICIYSPHYFDHGGKYKDILNSKCRKILDDWLRKDFEKGLSNWNIIRISWETSNPECRFENRKKVKTQPDYTKMDKFKSK